MHNVTLLTTMGMVCGGASLLAQINQNVQVDMIEGLVKAGGTSGLIICLIIAIKHLNAARNDTAAKIVQLLEDKMVQNTMAFKELKTEMHANTQQAEKQCTLLQSILYEFRLNQDELNKDVKDKHGHSKANKS